MRTEPISHDAPFAKTDQAGLSERKTEPNPILRRIAATSVGLRSTAAEALWTRPKRASCQRGRDQGRPQHALRV